MTAAQSTAHRLRPEVVMRVAFLEWTAHGRIHARLLNIAKGGHDEANSWRMTCGVTPAGHA